MSEWPSQGKKKLKCDQILFRQFLDWCEVYVQHYNGDIVIEDKSGDSGMSLFTGALIHKIEPEEPK